MGTERGRQTLKTKRLQLRPLAARDAAGLHEAYGDPEAMKFWDMLASRDLAQTRARIPRNTPRHPAWAILSKDGKRFLGMVNYHHREAWNRRLEVGYILSRRHWGKGLMLEALRAFLDHCFADLDTHRIEAIIEPANGRSIRLAEGLGFRAEGLMRDRLCVGGRFRSVIMYGLLAEDWPAHREKSQRAPKPPGR